MSNCWTHASGSIQVSVPEIENQEYACGFLRYQNARPNDTGFDLPVTKWPWRWLIPSVLWHPVSFPNSVVSYQSRCGFLLIESGISKNIFSERKTWRGHYPVIHKFSTMTEPISAILSLEEFGSLLRHSLAFGPNYKWFYCSVECGTRSTWCNCPLDRKSDTCQPMKKYQFAPSMRGFQSFPTRTPASLCFYQSLVKK